MKINEIKVPVKVQWEWESVPNKADHPTNVIAYDPYADEMWYVDPKIRPVITKEESKMKVTWEIKNVLSSNARNELEKAKAELTKAQAALDVAKVKVSEAEVVLDWASGLLVGADLMMKPSWDKASPKPFIRKLYYVPSKSGRRYGHYIEVLENDVRCTCPGFLNRHYCWATREIQGGVGIYKYIWLKSHRAFDDERERALNS